MGSSTVVLSSSGDYDPDWIVGVWPFEDGKLEEYTGSFLPANEPFRRVNRGSRDV